jgi:hypothetical protein
MTIKNQEQDREKPLTRAHYNPEEPKPVYRETKGFKYQIFKDHVRFLFGDQELPVSFLSLKHIIDNADQYQEKGIYTGQCIDCHVYDVLVKGYCQNCAPKNDVDWTNDK